MAINKQQQRKLDSPQVASPAGGTKRSSTSRSPRRHGGRAGRGATAAPQPPQQQSQPPARISAGPGGGDASSGGGACAGIPRGGTDLRTQPSPTRDEQLERDRRKLFPEARSKRDEPIQ